MAAQLLLVLLIDQFSLVSLSPVGNQFSYLCSGVKAIAKMKEVLGGDFITMGAGRVIEVADD